MRRKAGRNLSSAVVVQRQGGGGSRERIAVPGGRPAAVFFEALRPRRRAPRGAGGGAQDAGGPVPAKRACVAGCATSGPTSEASLGEGHRGGNTGAGDLKRRAPSRSATPSKKLGREVAATNGGPRQFAGLVRFASTDQGAEDTACGPCGRHGKKAIRGIPRRGGTPRTGGRVAVLGTAAAAIAGGEAAEGAGGGEVSFRSLGRGAEDQRRHGSTPGAIETGRDADTRVDP
mmetsp:Transcript_58443/g.127887  ORF Transcript_58443/g.127887 Transcript_58443/m.127887 type:complete len:231 (+) Transcript_58443:1769-2461(+)